MSGAVSRIYERNIRSYAYCIETSGSGSRLQLPRDASKGLGLVQRVIAFQVTPLYFPSSAFSSNKMYDFQIFHLCACSFCFVKVEIPADASAALHLELAITDGARVRRRIILSTAFREPTITPLHVQVKIANIKIKSDRLNGPRPRFVSIFLALVFLFLLTCAR